MIPMVGEGWSNRHPWSAREVVNGVLIKNV